MGHQRIKKQIIKSDLWLRKLWVSEFKLAFFKYCLIIIIIIILKGKGRLPALCWKGNSLFSVECVCMCENKTINDF